MFPVIISLPRTKKKGNRKNLYRESSFVKPHSLRLTLRLTPSLPRMRSNEMYMNDSKRKILLDIARGRRNVPS